MIKSSESTGPRMMVALFRLTPGRSSLIIFLLLLAGIAEGVGIASFLPLIAATGLGPENAVAVSGGDSISQLEEIMESIFSFLGSPPSLGQLLVLIAIIFWLKAGLVIVAMSQMGFAGAEFATKLRMTLLRSLMFARWSYFTKQAVGSLANAMTNEVNRASAAYGATFEILALLIQVVVYTIIAFLVSWQITLLAMVAGLVVFAVLHRLVTIARTAGDRQRQSYEIILTRLVDCLNGIKPIKAMAAEDQVSPMLEAETDRLYAAQRLIVISITAFAGLSEPLLVSFLCVGLMLAVSVFGADYGLLVVMALVFYRGMNRVTQVQGRYQKLVSHESFLRAIALKLEDINAAREQPRGFRPPALETSIEIKDLNFRFGEKLVLRNVNLRIPAKQMTSIIGPSGSGKTTLTDLLIGLYTPETGSIMLDDQPLQEVDLRAWRRMIGYVPQELVAFNGSIVANITLHDSDFTEEDAIQALKDAGAWEFVSELPDGLQSMVGERGAMLSGGQRQRLALARALIRKPKLLLLDEPTTALDPQTEAEICATLRGLTGRVTILAISHQAALVEAADLVYKIEDGDIQLDKSATTSGQKQQPQVA
jgi:ATP-binding cassette, subfamily C, bacterial